MSEQQDLRVEAARHLDAVKDIIDRLKSLGECPLDGDNALANICDRAGALADRAQRPWQVVPAR